MKELLAIVFLIGVIGCQDKKPTSSGSYSAKENLILVEEVKSANIQPETVEQILLAYIKIKDALVETDAKAASFEAEELLFKLGESKNNLVAQLFIEVEMIAESKDIQMQRIYFEGLSNNVYTLVKNIELETTYYRQYCPMAFNNTGAAWISVEAQIFNPYFGDVMLRCGKIKEIIK